VLDPITGIFKAS